MTGHIFIEGEIGADVTAKSVRADIANYPQAKDFIVHINSGGGDVYEGYQIGSILRSLGKKTKASIGSMCASIATAIAMNCDEVVMGAQGDFMIHLPTAGTEGTAEDLRKTAGQLDRIENELISLYLPRVAKKGITKEQLSAMLEQETSMSPADALQMGFIDAVEPPLKAVAKIDINKFNMEKHVTKEEMEGAFAEFGKKMDSFFSNIKKAFKNSVELAMADGSMVTSSASTPEELVGSVLTGPEGVLADGVYETADGFAITIAEGKVASYEPKTEDKKDSAKELEAAKSEIAALKEQLTAKTNEAEQAVKDKTAMEASVQTEFKNLKSELETLKKQTFGDNQAPPTGPKFKFVNEKGEEHDLGDPMQDLEDSFMTSRNLK